MSEKKPKIDLNPALMEHLIDPAVETEKKIKAQEAIDSLAVYAQDLTEMRKQASIEARKADIDYINKLDRFISTTLEAITEDPETWKEIVKQMLQRGKMRELKDLMVSLGITMDKRESLLAFDDTRVKPSKKKLKLNVVWQGSDGSKMGAQAEVDG
jgi:hypothetical protein